MNMIRQVDIHRINGVELIHVALDASVGKYDHSQVASALFGIPECESYRRYFLSHACRGVAGMRLPVILETGIDVEPTTSPIWISSLDKAMEYGNWPKAIVVLKPGSLDRTFRELPTTSSAATLAAVRQLYPTEFPAENGSTIWYTRLSQNDRRAATPYEQAYGYWIPGNARDALIGIFLLDHPSYNEDCEVAVNLLAKSAP